MQGKINDIKGCPPMSSFIRPLMREDYFINHPSLIFSFSIKQNKDLLTNTGFVTIALYYDLPKFNGDFKRQLSGFFQHAPLFLKKGYQHHNCEHLKR